MNDRIGGIHQGVVLVVGKAKPLTRQVAAKNAHTRIQVFKKITKRKMELQRGPQPLARFFFTLCTDKKIQRIAMSGEKSRGDIAAQISGRAGYEDRHSGSDGVAEFDTTAARACSGDQSSSRGARASSGRPSING